MIGQALNESTVYVHLFKKPTHIQDWMGRLAPAIWSDVGHRFEFDFCVSHYPGETDMYVVRWYVVSPGANGGVVVTFAGLARETALQGFTWSIWGSHGWHDCRPDRLAPRVCRPRPKLPTRARQLRAVSC